MNRSTLSIAALAVAGLMAAACVPMQVAPSQMSFFVTSAGTGKGADLGGLAGADAHCASLAKAAGSTATN